MFAVKKWIQPKLPYREAGIGGGGRERHFDKLVPVCGNVFKSSAAILSSPLLSSSQTRRATSLRKGEAAALRHQTDADFLLLERGMERKRERGKERNPPLFFQAALCLLNSFYLGTIRARAYPIIDFISFHGRCFRGEKRDVEREGGREGNGSRRNARHFARKNRPTSTDDRRLFEFLRVEAIFLQGVDGGNRSCLQIARDNALESSLSLFDQT